VGLPATRKYRQYLRDYKLQLMEMWSNGRHQAPRSTEYAVKDADAVARAQTLADLADMDYAQLETFYFSEKEQSDGNSD